MRTRRAISTAAARKDLRTLAAGVGLMRQRSEARRRDPLGWWYQSRMHGNPEGSEHQAGDPRDWDQCQHGSWFFLPWHRMFLFQLEQIIAVLTDEPDFALPYWDYKHPAGAVVPPAFRDPDSPLFDPTRQLQPLPQPPQQWARAGSFVRMGGEKRTTPAHNGEGPGLLEQNPHNLVHAHIGGDLGAYQSPLDPLFWIHHCNIDRLWETWLGQPGRANPTDARWRRTSFSFPDPHDPSGRRTFRVEEVGTAAQLGYEYDDVELREHHDQPVARAVPRRAAVADDGVEAARPTRSDADLELVGASTEPSTAPGGVVVRTAAPAAGRMAAFRVTDDGGGAGGAAPEGLFLRLENVGIDGGDASDMWNVYVAVGAGDRALVGTIAPFGLAGLTARGGRQTLTFDISDLAPEVAEDDGGVTVSIEPVKQHPEHRPSWERTALYATPR